LAERVPPPLISDLRLTMVARTSFPRKILRREDFVLFRMLIFDAGSKIFLSAVCLAGSPP
jgi:hypothetical protein